jgi:hypothetical protein
MEDKARKAEEQGCAEKSAEIEVRLVEFMAPLLIKLDEVLDTRHPACSEGSLCRVFCGLTNPERCFVADSVLRTTA